MDFSNFNSSMKKARDTTVTEARKLNKIRQLNSRIHKEQKTIAELYSDIGEKLYNLYKEAPLEEFESEFESLSASFDRVEDLQEELRSVRGVRICPSCKAEVKISERYCPNCGFKMPELPEPETAEGEIVSDDAGTPEEAEAGEPAENTDGAENADDADENKAEDPDAEEENDGTKE